MNSFKNTIHFLLIERNGDIMKKVAFYTLGCKVNQYETNAMIEKFIEKKYTIVDFEAIADIYVINTCTVTNMSDRKSRQIIRRVKLLNPKSILVVTGCYAQVASQELEKIEDIDLIIGNTEKKDIVEIVENYIIALNKKLYNKNVKQFYCLSCMAENLEVSEEDLLDKIEEFKEAGCVLFK